MRRKGRWGRSVTGEGGGDETGESTDHWRLFVDLISLIRGVPPAACRSLP